MRSLLESMTIKDIKEKINAKDEDGRTALHCAVRNKHYNVVKLLLEHGAGEYRLEVILK